MIVNYYKAVSLTLLNDISWGTKSDNRVRDLGIVTAVSNKGENSVEMINIGKQRAIITDDD